MTASWIATRLSVERVDGDMIIVDVVHCPRHCRWMQYPNEWWGAVQCAETPTPDQQQPFRKTLKITGCVIEADASAWCRQSISSSKAIHKSHRTMALLEHCLTSNGYPANRAMTAMDRTAYDFHSGIVEQKQNPQCTQFVAVPLIQLDHQQTTIFSLVSLGLILNVLQQLELLVIS